MIKTISEIYSFSKTHVIFQGQNPRFFFGPPTQNIGRGRIHEYQGFHEIHEIHEIREIHEFHENHEFHEFLEFHAFHDI